jgi:ELWxxDGT repeat protein
MTRKAILFNGTNADNKSGIWVSNGDAAGTYELPGIAGINAASNGSGLDPTKFVPFNNRFFFTGVDSSPKVGLWFTDGTSAGTQELTGINGVYAAGLSPTGLQVANGKLLFEGSNSAHQATLWTTDGTSVGTHEVTGIVGANANGIFSSSFFAGVTYHNNLIFTGTNAAGQDGLWRTDGTATGTFELSNIAGASPYGLFGSSDEFVVFQDRIYFSGINASGAQQLWVSDGTAAGTYEVAGIAGANASSFEPAHFVVFDGHLMFSARDTTGYDGLWISDGTSSGTYELGTPGPTGISDHWPIAYHDHALFTEFYFGGYSLYITDGTVPGTHEVVKGLMFREPVAFDDKVYFLGYGNSTDLWVTDGTASGTHDLSEIPNAFLSGLFPRNMVAVDLPTVNADVTGDGRSDIVWRSTGGDVVSWYTGFEGTHGGKSLGNVGTNWAIIDTGDFDGDGKADLLWRATNGDTVTWENIAQSTHGGQSFGNVGIGWNLLGAADFNGDHKDDMLWRANDGTLATWENLNNGSHGGQSFGTVGTNWKIVGTGDFDGDGKSDILWRANTGDVVIWDHLGVLGNGTHAGETLGNVGLGWHVAGTGDVDGDGKSDILWRADDGHTVIWNNITNNPDLGPAHGGIDLGVVGVGWTIQNTGDYDGDGKADILWRSNSGNVVTWENIASNGSHGGVSFGNVGVDWSIQQHHYDFV